MDETIFLSLNIEKNSKYLFKNLIIIDIVGPTNNANINVPIPIPIGRPIATIDRKKVRKTQQKSKTNFALPILSFFTLTNSLKNISYGISGAPQIKNIATPIQSKIYPAIYSSEISKLLVTVIFIMAT